MVLRLYEEELRRKRRKIFGEGNSFLGRRRKREKEKGGNIWGKRTEKEKEENIWRRKMLFVK